MGGKSGAGQWLAERMGSGGCVPEGESQFGLICGGVSGK